MNKNKIKYLVHEGTIPSKNDGEFHRIKGEALINLYKLDKKECHIMRHSGDIPIFVDLKNPLYIHIWPRFDGDYPLYKEVSPCQP